MAIVSIFFKVLFIIIGALVAFAYTLFQFWQKVPSLPFSLGTKDIAFIVTLGLLCGLGFNSYWGLLAPFPFILWKYAALKRFQKKYLTGAGHWMEVEWKKMTPRGFNTAQVSALSSAMGQFPQTTHFLIPRPAALFVLNLLMKKFKSQTGRYQMGAYVMDGSGRQQKPLSSTEMQQGTEYLEQTALNIRRLPKGQTTSLTLIFGVLKITRL